MIEVSMIRRAGAKCYVVIKDHDGTFREMVFPSGKSDPEILRELRGDAAPAAAQSKKSEPVKEPEPEEPKEENPVAKAEVPREKASAGKESRRELKEKYLRELKAAGIDKSKEPSFSRIETAWLKHCGNAAKSAKKK